MRTFTGSASTGAPDDVTCSGTTAVSMTSWGIWMTRTGSAVKTVAATAALAVTVALAAVVTLGNNAAVATNEPGASSSTTSTTEPQLSAACREVERRGTIPVPYGGTGMYTKVRITKVDANGWVYLDLRKEPGTVALAPLFNNEILFDQMRSGVAGGDCLGFRGAKPGKWQLDVRNPSGTDSFYWTYRPGAARSPKLDLRVKKVSANKFRLAWKTQRVSRLKVQVVNTRTGRVTRTVLLTGKTKGVRSVRISKSATKRLRAIAVGKGGKVTRRVALPR